MILLDGTDGKLNRKTLNSTVQRPPNRHTHNFCCVDTRAHNLESDFGILLDNLEADMDFELNYAWSLPT